MRLVQDPEGLWVGRPAFARKIGGARRPVAIFDAAVAETDGPPLRIAVLDNDIDPEGDPLTLVSAYAALGSATAEADGTVTYVPPPGFAGADTVVYEIMDSQGLTDTGQVDVTVAAPVLAVAVTADNRLEITAASAPIDLTFDAPAAFQASYAPDVARLAEGPEPLAPPTISGDAASVGATLRAVPGLWIHDTASTPSRTWQWRRDGADIAGATGDTRMVEAADIGATLSVVETLSDAFGSRAFDSLGNAVGQATPTPADDAGLIAWYDADDTATLTTVGSEVTAWADKAGANDLAQDYDPIRPASGVRSLNGRNVVTFDGGQMITGALSLPASGDVAFHLALEIDVVTSAYNALFAVDATRDFQFDAASDTQFDGRLNGAGIGGPTLLSGGPFAGPVIVSVLFDFTGAGTAEVHIGNVLRATMAYTAPLDAAQVLKLMTNRSENAAATGTVAEVIVTSSLDSRAAHYAYLSAKWGIS